MPLIKDILTEQKDRILVWKDEETLEFFLEKTELNSEDSQKLEKYTNERRKKDLLIARYLLQTLIPTAEVNYLETGKPFLKNNEAKISISHTKDLVAIMVSKDHTVGIDIEYISPRVDKLAQRFLSEEEIKIANNTMLRTLYWSAKESLFKLDDKQGLDFKTEITLSTTDNNNLEGRIRNTPPIRINCWNNKEWVMTYATR